MKQLIHNITTSISLSRVLARRLVLLLAVLLVGVVNAWGQNVKTTLKASGATLSNGNKTATWTDSYVTFTLTGNKAMSRTGSGDNAYFKLSPNTTYTLTWTVRNQNANAFNVVSSASATTHINRTSTASPATFWDEDKVAIVFSTSNNNNGSARHDHYDTFKSDGFNLSTQLNGSASLKFTTEKASQSHKAWFVTWTASFEYRLKDITVEYSLFRKFHYSATVKRIKEDGTSVDGTYGDAYASFTNGQYSNSSVSGVTTASTVGQTSISKQVYFYANPNVGNDKVFIGWKSSLNATSYLSTDPYYDQELTNITSQDIDHPANLTLYAVFGDKYVRQIDYKTNESLIQLKVDDIVNNAFTISNCGGSNVPDNGNVDGFDPDEHEFYYVISSTVDDNVEGCNSNHEGDVITYDAVNRTITAWNAGTATITFYQKGTNTIVSNLPDGVSFTFNVSKDTPSVSWNSSVPYYFNQTYPNTNYLSVFTLTSGDAELIDNYASTDTDVATFVKGVVTTYNVDRSTTLSVHLAENYKWDSKTFTKTIHPKKMDNHVPFTINSNDKYGTFVQSTSGNIAFESSNVIKMNNGSWTKNENAIVISFTGIPDKLKFSTSTLQDKTILIPIYPSAGDHNYYAYESSDGQVWTSVWDNPTDLSTSNNVVQLQPTTRFIKLRYHGTVYGQFVNVEVTELHKFQGEPNPIDFGKVQTDEHPVDYIYFEHANAGYRVEATSSLPAIFVVDPTVVPNTGGDKMGGEYCQVTFHPENAALNTETIGSIIFTDQLGNSTSVSVKGYATSLQVPKFTWNPLNMPYYCASTEPGAPGYYSIPNICSSSNNGPNAPELSYSSDNEGAAKVVNGDLQIYVRDDASRPYPTITITVSQAACAGWESKTQKFTFTPHKKADISVPFYVTKEIFEDAYAIECPIYHHLWGNESGYEWDNEQKEFRLGSAQMTARKAPHPAFDWGNEKSVTFNFDGTPDVISFNYKLNQIGATWYQSGQDNLKPHFVVYESTDGIQWQKVGSIECRSTNYSTPARVQLSPTTAFVKLEYQGNYGGLLKDVQVTALDGYYFMKSGDKYLSRGGTNRDKAVMDDYGIAVRKTRSTNNNNSKEFTHLQYVDNEKFLCESGGVLITNSEEKRTFTATKNADGTYILKSENDTKQYLRANGNALGLTADDAQAILWKLEETDDHKATMKAIRDAQVYSATEEFGEIVSSYAKLRERLENEDYDRDTVFSYYMSGDAQEQYQGTPNNNSVVYSQLIQNNVKLVPGLYCLNVKAFYRIAPNERAYKIHDLGYDSPVAYVSLKDESNGDVANTQIGSLYEFHDNKDNYTGDDPFFKDYQVGDAYYPNCLESAKKSFARRFVYDNDAFMYVSEKANGLGEVTISIIAPSNSNDYNWLCYKDITLTRLYRKEFTFDGSKNQDWSEGDNWEYNGGRGTVPEKMHKVVIAAPAVVGDGANAGAYKITFDSQVQNSSVTVKAGGSLSVREGGFVGATHSNLVLEADGNGQTGALLLHPEMEDMPNATVQFYSTIANKKTDKEWQWQYIGTPIKNPDTNEHIFYQCWLFQHSIEDDEWTNAGNWGHMEPFRGYAFTRDNYRSSGPLFGFCGQLNDARRKELPLSYVVKNGNVHNENQIANSWTAPIRLSNLTEEDFIGVDPNIYYYQRDGQGVTSIGPFSAKYTGMDVIPAMQGFFVKTTEEKGEKQHKLVLDYKRLVWDFEKEELFRNEPLKAPSREREEQDELLSRVCINLMSADSIPDQLYLIEKEGEGFSREFTEGYDAPKYFVDGLPCIYTYETSGTHLAVSATDDVVGTYLAINTNASQNYTLTFSKVIGEGLGLRDLVTNTIVPITEGMQYAFTAPANSSPMLRFVVVEHEETPQWNNNNGTSLEDVGGEFKIWQSGEILSVIGAGSHASLRIYDAAGKLILSEFFNEATAINLNALPTGVYMVQVNDKTEKVLR